MKEGFGLCPKCLAEGKETPLSELYPTEEGNLAYDCPVHGKLYLWGAFKVEEGKVIDLLTGESLKI